MGAPSRQSISASVRKGGELGQTSLGHAFGRRAIISSSCLDEEPRAWGDAAIGQPRAKSAIKCDLLLLILEHRRGREKRRSAQPDCNYRSHPTALFFPEGPRQHFDD